MTDQRWCIDDHHGTPCPEPCPPCKDECSGITVTTGEAVAEFPDWQVPL